MDLKCSRKTTAVEMIAFRFRPLFEQTKLLDDSRTSGQ